MKTKIKYLFDTIISIAESIIVKEKIHFDKTLYCSGNLLYSQLFMNAKKSSIMRSNFQMFWILSM